MYNIDKPQERRKATGTGGIPPENIRLRRTLTTEYLQLSLCYSAVLQEYDRLRSEEELRRQETKLQVS